jgi:hypothetical protein
MQRAERQQQRSIIGTKPSDHHARCPNGRHPMPSQFDLVVTFTDTQQAHEALLALRHERFGPDQAVLLARGPLSQDDCEAAAAEFQTESNTTLAIIVATEIVGGALFGAVVGWLGGLYHSAPTVSPVWVPTLIVGGIGAICGAVLGALEFRRWRQTRAPTRGEAAIALRLRGPGAAERLARAQAVLERFGGQENA